MKFDDAINKLSQEVVTRIKDADSLEEIIRIFKDNGLNVTEADVYEAIRQKSQELSDDEL